MIHLDRKGRRHRGSAKRYLTQPVDREAIAQAKELQRNSQATQVRRILVINAKFLQ